MFLFHVLLLILIPIIGAYFIYVFRKNENQREGASFVTAFCLFGLVLHLFNANAVTGEVVHALRLFPGDPFFL